MDKTKLEDLLIQPTPLDNIIDELESGKGIDKDQLCYALEYVRDEIGDLRVMLNMLLGE